MRYVWALVLCGAVAAPLVARADRDEWREHHGGDRDWRGEGWRGGEGFRGDRDYREREWREHERGFGPRFHGPGIVVGRGYGDRRWARPRIDIDLYSRPYAQMPRFRRFGTFGLVQPLTTYPNLSFLQDGQLVGSYYQNDRMVYVYIIDEGAVHHEIRVDQYGTILSDQIVP